MHRFGKVIFTAGAAKAAAWGTATFGQLVFRRVVTASAVALVAVAVLACGNPSASDPAPAADFHGCPPQGRGGDPDLNRLKNRTEAGNAVPSSVERVLSLSWPKTAERRGMARWPQQDRSQVDAVNAQYVQVEGYLVAISAQGPESANCESTTDVDFHVWMTASLSDQREKSVVIEVTPRQRAVNQELSMDAIRGLVSRRTRVRVTGWMMLDPEHPEQVGKSRGTLWEVHPVIKIESVP